MKQMVELLMLMLMLMVVGCGDKDNPISSEDTELPTTTTLTVVNDLSYSGFSWTIYNIYISPVSNNTWGTDRLGAAETLRFGWKKNVYFIYWQV